MINFKAYNVLVNFAMEHNEDQDFSEEDENQSKNIEKQHEKKTFEKVKNDLLSQPANTSVKSVYDKFLINASAFLTGSFVAYAVFKLGKKDIRIRIDKDEKGEKTYYKYENKNYSELNEEEFQKILEDANKKKEGTVKLLFTPNGAKKRQTLYEKVIFKQDDGKKTKDAQESIEIEVREKELTQGEIDKLKKEMNFSA